MCRHAIMSVVLALGAINAATAAEFFVGRWASSPTMCAGAGEGASTRPMIVTENSLHRSALSCRIGNMYKTGSAVHIQAHCATEGRNSTVPVTLEARGDRLGVIWNGEQMVEMQRCP